MNSRRTHKKNLIISYKNLTEELLQLFQERYPEGYRDYLQRFDKPNGETIFVVPLETDDSVYMIKFDVKIDTAFDDDDGEKDYFDEEVEKAGEEFAPLQEAIDKEDEEVGKSTIREVRHGAYEEENDDSRKRIKSGALGALGDELKEAFADDIDDDEYDEYSDEEEADEDEKDPVMGDDYEPTDEELMSIDSAVYANAEIPPEELARMAAEEAAAEPKKSKRGRKKKVVEPEPVVPAAPKKKGRPRKIKE